MQIKSLKTEIAASCVGALATLPQAVAYGLIAFSPLGPEWAAFGILASVGSAIAFGIISGFVSSNPFMISGPSALTALVLATGLEVAVSRGYAPEQALQLAFVGIVISGLFQLVAGLARLGHAVSYIPVPVLAGFVNASAILVLLSSLPMVLGIPESSITDIFLHGGIRDASLWAICISGLTITCNFLFDGRIRILPAALIGLAAGTIAYHVGINVGDVPLGPEVGHIDLLALIKMPELFRTELSVPMLLREIDIPLFTGLSIGLLGSFNTVLTGAALDMRTNNAGNVNKDLRAHGVVNALMGILGFLPASGALSRSMAIINSGATTRTANIGASVLFFLLLVLLAPVVATLPLWATSGMLLATAIQAIDKPTVDKLRGIVTRTLPYPRVLIGDITVTFTVVITAMALNLIVAVGTGIILAVILFVLGMGRDPVRRTFTAEKIHSKVQRPQSEMQILEREGHRIGIIEVQGALFFGACARLQSQARAMSAKGAEFIVLDFRHLTSIDSTGCALLRTIAVNCAEAGGRLLISCVERERRVDPSKRRRHNGSASKSANISRSQLRWIWLNLEANNVMERIGEDGVFDDTDTALAACEEILLKRLGYAGNRESRGIIASSDLFHGLSRAQIMVLGRYAQRHRFNLYDVVFEQGDFGDRAYFLVSGRMDVLIDIPGSVRKRRVSALTEGTLFAEMGLIDGGARSATVRAVRSSACLSIDAESFSKLQNEIPDVALILMHNVARQFAHRLRHANNMISELER